MKNLPDADMIRTILSNIKIAGGASQGGKGGGKGGGKAGKGGSKKKR